MTHEEECLFFVALSRARTHLRLYLRPQAAKWKWAFTVPISDLARRRLPEDVANPRRLPLPPAHRAQPIAITWAARLVRHRQPIWGLTRNARAASSTRTFWASVAPQAHRLLAGTHDCLYDLMRWLAEARRSATPPSAEAEAAFEAIWNVRGPADHAFADDYRRLASRLIGGAGQSRGRTAVPGGPTPCDRLSQWAGVGRTERTSRIAGRHGRHPPGSDRSTSGATSTTGSNTPSIISRRRPSLEGDAAVQALHLTDETQEPVAISATKLGNRQKKSDTMLAGIAAGEFPTEVDAVTCPRCPHFFICAAAPPGPLKLG